MPSLLAPYSHTLLDYDSVRTQPRHPLPKGSFDLQLSTRTCTDPYIQSLSIIPIYNPDGIPI